MKEIKFVTDNQGKARSCGPDVSVFQGKNLQHKFQ